MNSKKKGITFSEVEIKDLQENPEALRALANYHEVRINEAASLDMEASVKWHETRRDELLTAAVKIESDY